MAISISQLKLAKAKKETYLKDLQHQQKMTECQYIGSMSNVPFEPSLDFEINQAQAMDSKMVELDLEISRTRYEIEAIESDIKTLEEQEALQKQ